MTALYYANNFDGVNTSFLVVEPRACDNFNNADVVYDCKKKIWKKIKSNTKKQLLSCLLPQVT